MRKRLLLKLLLLSVCFIGSFNIVFSKNTNNVVENFQLYAEEPSGTLKVVTTLSIIADWAANVGEGLFTPMSVVTGSEDPHTYSLTSGEIETIGKSDLFIRFGLMGIEPWVQHVLEAFPSLNVLTLASSDLMEIDNVTGEPNPHVWMSPKIVKNFINNITTAIISLDFANKENYEINGDAYLTELDELIVKLEGEYKNEVGGTKVVVYHPAFYYLFKLIDVERIGVIEEHEGSEPSAQHIQDIVDAMLANGVKIIVSQPQIEESVVYQIARDTEAKIAELTPLLNEVVTTYIGMIEYNIFALQNPKAVPKTNWSSTSLIIGISIFSVSSALVVYLRLRK